MEGGDNMNLSQECYMLGQLYSGKLLVKKINNTNAGSARGFINFYIYMQVLICRKISKIVHRITLTLFIQTRDHIFTETQ